MDSTSVPRSLGFGDHERLLYVVCLSPHGYEDGTHDGQVMVTALFAEPNVGGGLGYGLREYSLDRRGLFYRFPKEDGHGSRGGMRQEWYRETQTELPESVFEAVR